MPLVSHCRFQLRPVGLAVTLAGLLAGCAGTPQVGPHYHRADAERVANPARDALVRVAAQQIGTPYRYGGSSRRGFDCSGLVQYVHRRVGIEVPRTTHSQWQAARVPTRDHLMPGDLLFFDLGVKKTGHVAIYEGDGRFIHAPSGGKRVGRASLDNPFWAEHLVGSKTFL